MVFDDPLPFNMMFAIFYIYIIIKGKGSYNVQLFPFRYDKSLNYTVGRALEHVEWSGTIIYKWSYSTVHDKAVWVAEWVGKWCIEPWR